MANFKQNELFRGDPNNHHLNACVGENGGPYDLFDYSCGYFEATGILLKGIEDDSTWIDLLIYPACLNFRHSIELYLKYLISQLAVASGRSVSFKPNHSLQENWEIARGLFGPAKVTVSESDLVKMSTVIGCVMEIDGRGETFRYPETLKGDPTISGWSLINVGVLREHLEATFSIAKDWHYAVEGRINRVLDC